MSRGAEEVVEESVGKGGILGGLREHEVDQFGLHLIPQLPPLASLATSPRPKGIQIIVFNPYNVLPARAQLNDPLSSPSTRRAALRSQQW